MTTNGYGSATRTFALTVLFTASAMGSARLARAQGELRPLSVTKLKTVGPETIPAQRIEAGLLWQMGWYGSRFTGSGEAEDLDLLSTRAELALRMVAGIFETRAAAMELGFLIPVAFHWQENAATLERASATGMGDIPFGFKIRFLSERLASVAVATVVTIPTGDKPAGLSHGYAQLAGGILFASQPTSWLSIDANFSVGGTLGVADADASIVPAWGLSHELGLALLTPVLMPCLELVWRANGATGENGTTSHALALQLGFNLQLNDRVILTQGAQIDLAGSNIPKGAAWLMSFLFLI